MEMSGQSLATSPSFQNEMTKTKRKEEFFCCRIMGMMENGLG